MSQSIDITARRSRLPEIVFIWVCRACVAIPLAMLTVLIADVAIDGMARLDWDFIKGMPSRRAWKAGIWPAVVGSLALIALTAVLALPLGVGAAIYLEEYGKRNRLASIIEVNIANLAGVPSVIYGLLGLEIFVRFARMGPSLIAGACTMALLILPIVIMSAREALRTVSDMLREAGLALGATRWQTIRQIVLPLALPGILTGAILAVSRAIGEAAPLIVIGAVVYITFLPDGLGSEFTALPIQIFNWVSMPQQEFLINAAAGIVVLLATLLLVNSFAIYLRNRYQRRSY
jgi:phosphate transport system permease protein